MNDLWFAVFAGMAATVAIALVTYVILYAADTFDHDEVQLEADEEDTQ